MTLTQNTFDSLAPDAVRRRRLTVEVWLVLALSLGRSGIYALVSLLDRLTWQTPLGQQTTTLHEPRSQRPWWDLLYQLLAIGFAVVPVLLVLYLLGGGLRAVLRRIGLDGLRRGRDLGWGVAIAAAIGLPGLGFYALGRVLGITLHIETSALNQYWWTIPVLVLSAVQNALVEEVVVVAYLVNRLRELTWRPWAIYAASAVLRGSYHLYQGWGPFLGNAVMGLAFVWWFRRSGRLTPLVVAHTLLDIVSFVGPSLIPTDWLG